MSGQLFHCVPSLRSPPVVFGRHTAICPLNPPAFLFDLLFGRYTAICPLSPPPCCRLFPPHTHNSCLNGYTIMYPLNISPCPPPDLFDWPHPHATVLTPPVLFPSLLPALTHTSCLNIENLVVLPLQRHMPT